MDINKKNRSELKGYFVKNSIPTESNFAELIEGMLNQKDDGIVKLSGEPLSIQAVVDTVGLQKVINFYADFIKDTKPAWTLQLNTTDPAKPAVLKSGFCISDGQGINRLFIDSSMGNVGIGTVTPSGVLDIANLVRFGLDEGTSGPKSISFVRDAGDEVNAGKITYKGGFGSALNIVGAGALPRKIKLYDNVEVAGALQVNAGIFGATLNVTGSTSVGALQVNGNTILNTFSAKEASVSILRVSDSTILNTLNVTGLTNIGVLQVSSGATLNMLKISGIMTPSAGSTEANGILFPKDPGGGGGDAAWIRYYSRNPADVDAAKKEQMTLEIGISNDANDHIALMSSGNVGIGTTNPAARLSIVASGATEIVGTAQSTTFRTSAGSLGAVLGNEISLTSIGFLSGGNNTSLGIRAFRFNNGSDWTTAAIGLGIDVDNSVRPNDASLWLHPAGRVGISTSNPQAKLHVNGDSRIEGSLSVVGNMTVGNKLTLNADNTRIKGNVMVSGSVLCDGGSPLADTNYKIELVGSAFESTEGNVTYLKINDVSITMTTLRGLNTVILNPNGNYKNSANHDVYGSALTWNTWADWVNSNTQAGDIVAVASFDAISNAPRGGTAETLLNNIGVERVFSIVTVSNRTPYTLLFIKGGGIAQEVVSSYQGRNAHLTTISCNLLTRQNQWRDAVLQNSWVRYNTTFNPPQYFKDSNGIVWLRGLVRSGTAGSVIFVLPEGYRPSNQQLHVVAAYDPTNIIGNANNGVGRIDILPDGRVLHQAGNNLWISLDSIAFRSYIPPVFIFIPPPIVIIDPLPIPPIVINPLRPTPVII